ARYTAGEARGPLLARLDGALAAAEQGGSKRAMVAAAGLPLRTSVESWRALIADALDQGGLALQRFPVLGPSGQVLHFESPVRLRLDGACLNAGQFLPWAARAGLIERIDAQVLATACALLADDPGCPGLAINLSTEAVSHT